MPVNKIHFDKIESTELSVSFSEVDKNTPFTHREIHMHKEYEIYINTGGVDAVELDGRLYPIPRDSVVIIRPYAGHRCIFRSEGMHSHFWLLLNAGDELMETLLDNEEGGSIIRLERQDFESLTGWLQMLLKGENSIFERYIAFFTILDIMKRGKTIELAEEKDTLPEDVVLALEYMEKHIAEKIAIDALARASHVSINTLERHFSEYLQLSPSATLRRKRLITAAKFLSHGMSVSEACESSGFTDYSNFIATFRKFYGMTPLKYQKNTKKQS